MDLTLLPRSSGLTPSTVLIHKAEHSALIAAQAARGSRWSVELNTDHPMAAHKENTKRL